jgi:dTDP-4-dehydrorhamnose reductase
VKILLLGANGQLGQTFLADNSLTSMGDVVAASRDGMLVDGRMGVAVDISDLVSLRNLLERERPKVVINAAAYTAVDRAEQEESLALEVNGNAVDILGHWAAVNDSLVIHYSTDYVFAGDGPHPYTEMAPTGPSGAYGRSKLAGELALRNSGAHHFIFRTAWVYAPVGHNFLRTMLRLGAERDQLRVVSDQWGSPTDALLIVQGTLAALRTWLDADTTRRASVEGTYHLTASGSTSWHGFATAIMKGGAQHGLIPREPVVHAISTDAYPTPARRPAYSVLDNARFSRTFDFPLPDWQVGLDRTLKALTSIRD